MKACAKHLKVRELSSDEIVHILLTNQDSRLDCLLVKRINSELIVNWIIKLNEVTEILVGYPDTGKGHYYETYYSIEELTDAYRVYVLES